MALYQTKPTKVEAHQYTGNNENLLVAFAGHNIVCYPDMVVLRSIINGRQFDQVIHPTDWLVCKEYGVYSLYTNIEFILTFEKAKEPFD